MRTDWFFPRKLASRLAQSEVQNREVAYIMLANMLFTSFIFYGAFTWANPPWTLLSFIEAATVVVVTLIGFTKCYDAAGGDANESFAKHFNCLSFGAWFWVTLTVWFVYWAVAWLFRYGVLVAYNFEQIGLARNLSAIGGSFEWLWTFIAAVAWQLGFFLVLSRSLALARSDA